MNPLSNTAEEPGTLVIFAANKPPVQLSAVAIIAPFSLAMLINCFTLMPIV